MHRTSRGRCQIAEEWQRRDPERGVERNQLTDLEHAQTDAHSGVGLLQHPEADHFLHDAVSSGLGQPGPTSEFARLHTGITRAERTENRETALQNAGPACFGLGRPRRRSRCPSVLFRLTTIVHRTPSRDLSGGDQAPLRELNLLVDVKAQLREAGESIGSPTGCVRRAGQW